MNFGRFANATLADSFPARVKLLILELGLKSLACERGCAKCFYRHLKISVFKRTEPNRSKLLSVQQRASVSLSFRKLIPEY